MSNGKPKPAFYLVMLVIIAGLLYFGVKRFGGGSMLGGSDTSNMSQEEIDSLRQAGGAEAPDDKNLTTVKEYTYVAGSSSPK